MFGLYLLSWLNLDQFPKLPSRYVCTRCACALGMRSRWGLHFWHCHRHRTAAPEVARGTLSPAGLQRCQGPRPCQQPPTSTHCELGTVQGPHLCPIQQEGSARTRVTPAAPSAADGCVLSPGQIPSSPLVWCLCLGTLQPKSPHTANGVSVSRPVLSGRL